MTFNPNTNPTVAVSMDAAAVGRSSTASFLTVYQPRNPTSADVNYPIQQRWVNTTNPMAGTEFILQSYSNATGQLTANWLPLGVGAVPLITFDGSTNPGVLVGVSGTNNVSMYGDGTTITSTGNPGANRITFSTGGLVATSYPTNALGPAIPVAGVLNVLGAGGVVTTGVGNTITITAGAAVPLQFTENVGVAVPAGNNLNVLGGTGISTAGVGSTITITAAGNVATQYFEDVGVAAPAANILRIIGGAGISTAGAGNVVTITNTSVSALTFNEDSGSATPAAGIINIRGGTGISTSGAGSTVTITNSGTPSAFSAYATLAQNNVTGDATNYTVIFETELYDRGGEYNPATGVFTAAAAGIYFFGSVVEFSGINPAHTLGVVSINTPSLISQVGVSPAATVESNNTMGYSITLCVNLTAGQQVTVKLDIQGGPKTISIIPKAGNTAFATFFGFRIL